MNIMFFFSENHKQILLGNQQIVNNKWNAITWTESTVSYLNNA